MPDTILVADDDPATRDILGRFLGEQGYRVRTASDGKECLEALRDDPPRVVFLDLEMPGMSGLDVLRNIDKEGIDVTVVTISGHAKTDILAAKSLELGAAEFVSKPFDFDAMADDLLPRLLPEPGTGD